MRDRSVYELAGQAHAMTDEGERPELLERLRRYRRLLRDTIDPMARAAIEETIQELEDRLDRSRPNRPL